MNKYDVLAKHLEDLLNSSPQKQIRIDSGHVLIVACQENTKGTARDIVRRAMGNTKYKDVYRTQFRSGDKEVLIYLLPEPQNQANQVKPLQLGSPKPQRLRTLDQVSQIAPQPIVPPTPLKLDVVGGYETYGEYIKVGIKIMNHSSTVAIDVSSMLEVPEALTFSDPAVPYLRLGNVRPDEFQSAIYHLKPTRCVDGSIRGIVNYYDHFGNRHNVDIPPIHIRNICPFLTSKGVVVADWMVMLKTGLLDYRSTSFEFKGSPRMAFATAENRVRSLTLVERDEKTIDGGYCGYACYFGNAKYGGYYFATTMIVSGTERGGRITLTIYSNEPTIVTGYVQEIMEDVRKHIVSTQGITVLTGECPECGGELDPTEADEKGLIHCHHCRCLNVIPPWMRIK